MSLGCRGSSTSILFWTKGPWTQLDLVWVPLVSSWVFNQRQVSRLRHHGYEGTNTPVAPATMVMPYFPEVGGTSKSTRNCTYRLLSDGLSWLPPNEPTKP